MTKDDRSRTLFEKETLRAAVRARSEALERYAAWQSRHASTISTEDAIAGVAWLYELLPPDSRRRPIDPSGIIQLHQRLAALDRCCW